MGENAELTWSNFFVLPPLFVLLAISLTVLIEKLLHNSLAISGHMFGILNSAMHLLGIPLVLVFVVIALYFLPAKWPAKKNLCIWFLIVFGALCALTVVFAELINGAVDTDISLITSETKAIWNCASAAEVIIASLSLAAALTFGLLIKFMNNELKSLKAKLPKKPG